MKKIKSIIQSLGLMLAVAGCAGLDTNRAEPKRMVKDVPVQTDAAASPTDVHLRKRVLVLPVLSEKTEINSEMLAVAQEAILFDLNRSGQVVAVAPSEFKIDFAKFVKNGEYQFADLLKALPNSGVNAILEPRVLEVKIKQLGDKVGLVRQMKTQYEMQIKMRMNTVRRSRTVFNTIKTVTVEDPQFRVAERTEQDQFVRNNRELIVLMLKDAFMEFTPQLLAVMDKLSWEGRVAAISGDRIFLNVGQVSGVKIGDLMRVVDEGEDVYDPDSGSHLGKAQGKVKGTLEVTSYFGTDGSVAKLHSGGGFKENDRVEPY
ncbi:MAG TPA: hypothetical protein PLU50_00440 [Pseudobdellovibrionaceae bacterium]|nr:hypothetical protein [Pseudobdellovibrionaceae bacterium]